jgi:hypothetical protein
VGAKCVLRPSREQGELVRYFAKDGDGLKGLGWFGGLFADIGLHGSALRVAGLQMRARIELLSVGC